MKHKYSSRLLLGLTMILTVAMAFGCTQRAKTPPYQPMPVANTSNYDRSVIVHRGDDGSRQYYRDENGKIYYVDQGGAVHVIERNARVERGAAGLYYIIDDDNVNYSTDERGRLFYRDEFGRNVYVEEGGQGRVIDPLLLLHGNQYPRAEQMRSLGTCNDEWRRCNSSCYDSSSLGSPRRCLEDCDYKREQCLKPY